MKILLFVALSLVILSCKNDDKKIPAQEIKKDSATADSMTASPSIMEMDTSSAVVRSPDSVLLLFNLKKGKTYNYDMAFDIAQEGEGRKMSNHTHWSYSMAVVDEHEKIKTLRATYRQIQMSVDMNGQKMEFSSENGPGNPFDFFQLPSRMFAAVKGKSFTMEVNEKGEIGKVEGLDQIGEAMVNEMKLPEATKPDMLRQFKGRFNDDAIRQIFSPAFDIFPAKTVKAGDSWEKTMPAMGSGSATKTVYTVQSINGWKVKLRGVSRSPLLQIATLLIDARTGLVMDEAFTQTMTGKRTMNGKGRIIAKEQ